MSSLGGLMFNNLFTRLNKNPTNEVVGATFDDESYLFNFQRKENTVIYKTFLDDHSDLCFSIKLTLDKRIEKVDVRVAVFYNEIPLSGCDFSLSVMSRQFNYHPHSLLADEAIHVACVEVLSAVNRDVSFLDAIELAYNTQFRELEFIKTLVANYESTVYDKFSITGKAYCHIEDKIFYQCDFVSRILKTDRNEAYSKNYSFFLFDRGTYSFPDRGINFHHPIRKRGDKSFELKEIEHDIFDQKMKHVCSFLDLSYFNINLISNMKHCSLFEVTLNFKTEDKPYTVCVYAFINYQKKEIVVFDGNVHYFSDYTEDDTSLTEYFKSSYNSNSQLADTLCCLIINSAGALANFYADIVPKDELTPEFIALIEMSSI